MEAGGGGGEYDPVESYYMVLVQSQLVRWLLIGYQYCSFVPYHSFTGSEMQRCANLSNNRFE